MTNKSKLRSAVFVVLTLVTVGIVGGMNVVPNHRIGWGEEYGWWTAFTAFPILYLLHGVLSGILLDFTKKWLYLIAVPLVTAVGFFLGYITAFGLGFWDSLSRAMLAGVVFTVISLVGALPVLLLKKIILALKRSG